VLAGNAELGGDAQGAGVGMAGAVVAPRAGGWRVEITGELVGSAELVGNVELGDGAQRAGLGRHK